MSPLLLSLALLAEPAAASEAAATSSEPGTTRLAIMNLHAAGVPEEYAVGLTETIASHIARTGVFETISPKQIASLLAYEKRKDAFGGCVDDACFVQIAQVVKADHLIGGSVALVGDKLALNVVLIDAAKGSALQRASRETTSASDLIESAREASIVLLQPILGARRGYLKITSNVPEAEVRIDDQLRAEGAGQVIPLSAGPHTLRVSMDGFYAGSADVLIRPGRVEVERFSLIPAKETIEAYESKASLMRTSAYATGVLAIGAAILTGVFYSAATDDKRTVDSFTNSLQIEQARAGAREEALAAKDDFGTHQSLYLISLGAAVVSGAASIYLFLAGDDPDRYEEFRSMTGR